MEQSVYIAGDISYVTGTVNNVSYIWTLTGDHIWTATGVAIAGDGVYDIDIIAIDTQGRETQLRTTAYVGIHLKTDWTDLDYYNASDLNRVGAAVLTLKERLIENGISIKAEPVISWTILDIQSRSQMEKYLGGVREIRNSLNSLRPLPSTIRFLNSLGANQIEEALMDIENLLERMIAARIAQCGICYTGGLV